MSDRSPAGPNDARIVVFVSGALSETIRQPQIDCRPAATRGDLWALTRDWVSGTDPRPLRVGIIDGTTRGPSLPPKEVMQAISAGVRLYGAVGDGALRAAECASYGMTGVGKLFERARTQFISLLDEYRTPADGGPHDQSMAAWQVALSDAVADGTANDGDAQTFLSTARQVPWRQRTLAHVLASADQVHERERIQRARVVLSDDRRHVMREDAQALVQAMLNDD
jgi:hypothetical protein